MDPQVDEERIAFGMSRFDELDRFIGVLVNWHLFARAIERSISIVSVFRGRGRIRNHVVGQVPLAKVSRFVAAGLQQPRQRDGAGIQPIGHVAFRVAWHPSEVAVDVVASRELPRHHRRSTGRTHSAGNRESFKVRALACQAIDVGSSHIRMPMTRQIAPTPIVSKDEKDIGLFADRRCDRVFCGGTARFRRTSQNEQDHHCRQAHVTNALQREALWEVLCEILWIRHSYSLNRLVRN